MDGAQRTGLAAITTGSVVSGRESEIHSNSVNSAAMMDLNDTSTSNSANGKRASPKTMNLHYSHNADRQTTSPRQNQRELPPNETPKKSIDSQSTKDTDRKSRSKTMYRKIPRPVCISSLVCLVILLSASAVALAFFCLLALHLTLNTIVRVVSRHI
jgi:hypothetical protein